MIQATRIQRKGVEQYEKLKLKLEQHRERYDVLKRCGLEKEAKKEAAYGALGKVLGYMPEELELETDFADEEDL